jgi:hypothetical protein
MKFTKIPVEAFAQMQLNAGILASAFNPATGELDASDILGATTGGVNATCPPSITDYGEDVDNVPTGTKQLQKITGYEPRIAGTFLTVVGSTLRMIAGAADLGTVGTPKVTLRHELKASDFVDVWFIGDYSDKNGNSNGGFVAIHLMNALNTDGFSLQTNKEGKGNFAVNFRGFYDLYDLDKVPMEFYIKEGEDEPGDFGFEFVSAAGTETGTTALSGMTAAPAAGESYVYQTGYGLRNVYAGDILLGSAWTAWNGADEIAAATDMDIVLAIITTATGAAQHGARTIVVAKEA